MNRGSSRQVLECASLLINRTHSRRFARFGEPGSRKAYGLRASSAPFSQVTLRFDDRVGFME